MTDTYNNTNKFRLTLICFGASLVTSAFFTTIGLLVGPLADHFAIDITSATKKFSWFTGSYFIGSTLTFYVLDYVRTRTVLLVYSLIILGVALINLFNSTAGLLPVIFIIFGFTVGVSLCTAGTVISKIWHDKYRQVALISQDAIFNVGGVAFPLLTAFLLGAGIHWGTIYIIGILPVIAAIYLILISNFDFELAQSDKEENKSKAEWNFSVILAGIFLFLVVVSKYIIIIWLPNYAETYLGANTLQSGELISRIFQVALIGSIAGALIVAKVNIILFAGVAVLIGFLSSMQFTTMTDLAGLTLMVAIFGVSLAVLWSGFVAYGVAFVRSPSHKHVAYIFFCGGAGSTITPLASGTFVESFGLIPLFYLVPGLYGIVLFTIIGHAISLRLQAMPLGVATE